MRFIRTRLSWLLSFWLACQVVALAAPAVLAASGSTPVEELCTCPVGDHESCPMHHGTPADTDADTLCVMKACCAPVDVALLSMAGGTGVLPSAIALDRPQPSAHVIAFHHVAVDTPVSHDTPPPRS